MTKTEAISIALTLILVLVGLLQVPPVRDLTGRLHRIVVGVLCFLVAASTLVFILRPSPPTHQSVQFVHDPVIDSTVKSVTKSAAMTEMLSFYEHPELYDSVRFGAEAGMWWVAERDSGGAVAPIREAVSRLRLKRQRYGTANDPDSARNVLWIPFFVRVYAPGDSATVISLEEWYAPVYSWAGQRLHPPKHSDNLGGRFAVVYGLRKDPRTDKWLVRSSSAPYLQY